MGVRAGQYMIESFARTLRRTVLPIGPSWIPPYTHLPSWHLDEVWGYSVHCALTVTTCKLIVPLPHIPRLSRLQGPLPHPVSQPHSKPRGDFQKRG